MAKSELRIKANLLRKRGKSIREIVSILNIPQVLLVIGVEI